MIVALLQPHAIVPCFGSGWNTGNTLVLLWQLSIIVSVGHLILLVYQTPYPKGEGSLVQFCTQKFTVWGISEA